MVRQRREVTGADIERIGARIAAPPARGRTPLSADLCRRWNGRHAQGRLKDMAYHAATWRRLGQTWGRTRHDRDHGIQAPVKDGLSLSAGQGLQGGTAP